jgi:hypothetical protein
MEVTLAAYAYGPALKLLEQSAGYLDHDQAGLVEAMLRYAIARRNLDLAAAVQALDPAVTMARELRELIASFQQEVEDTSEVAKLRETIFLAQIAAVTDNWADFLARLYRFSEGCMQLLAEQLGVRWSDPQKRNSYKMEWWNEQRAMLATLGLAAAEPPVDPVTENKHREADRISLRAIITALATEPEQAGVQQALAQLALIDKPIPLRNDIVHRFSPLSREEIERKAGISSTDLLMAMRRTYTFAFSQVVSEQSPYNSLNLLCIDMLKGRK